VSCRTTFPHLSDCVNRPLHLQHCKFGFHLAVAMGKRSIGKKSSSTSTPHVIALVDIF
jgi:hypothetical protein